MPSRKDVPLGVLRVSIALSPTHESARMIGALQGKLRAALPAEASVRWVPPAQIRVPLFFLGPTSALHVEGIREAITGSAWLRGIEALALGSVRCLPETGEPKLLWAGVREYRALVAVREGIEAVVGPIVGAGERERAYAQVVLGRVAGAGTRGIREAVAEFEETGVSFEPEALVLLASMGRAGEERLLGTITLDGGWREAASVPTILPRA